jgi:hypothetical protein
MTDQILGKIIDGSALIISTLISVGGIWLIARHRKNVIKFAMNVEGCHRIEQSVVEEVLVAQGNENPTEGQIRFQKGQRRTNILGENSEKLMSGKEAMQLRKKYFGKF